MAYDLTNFSDYIARENKTLTKTLFVGGDTGQFATKIGGVKGKTTIPHLSGAVKLQAGNCPNPDGSKVATSVELEVKPFTIYEEYCQDDIQTKFPNMVLGSNNGDSLAPWEEELINLIVSDTNEQLEVLYWQGDVTGSTINFFDGMIKKIDASGLAKNGNPDSVTAVTASNVVELVENMHTLAPAKVNRSKDFVIVVGDDIFNLYIKALKKANLYHYAPEHDNGVFKIGGSGATLRRIFGLDQTQRMFASVAKNFVLGSDIENEKDLAEVWYDKDSDKMKVRIKGKAGVTVANLDEIVSFSL